jgi:hypothetical protein
MYQILELSNINHYGHHEKLIVKNNFVVYKKILNLNYQFCHHGILTIIVKIILLYVKKIKLTIKVNETTLLAYLCWSFYKITALLVLNLPNTLSTAFSTHNTFKKPVYQTPNCFVLQPQGPRVAKFCILYRFV